MRNRFYPKRKPPKKVIAHRSEAFAALQYQRLRGDHPVKTQSHASGLL